MAGRRQQGAGERVAYELRLAGARNVAAAKVPLFEMYDDIRRAYEDK